MTVAERRRVEASVQLRQAARLIEDADAKLISVSIWEYEPDLSTARAIVLRGALVDRSTKYQ